MPDYGAGRMGREGSLYQIAQWYPRLAVYDDVRGWNHDPYIGAGEFYLEYGSFDVSLTVPASYIVSATARCGTPSWCSPRPSGVAWRGPPDRRTR